MNKKHLHSLKNNPKLAIVGLLSLKLFSWIPDRVFLKIAYRCRTGLKLDLDNPKRFNEKLQWLKLHDRQERYVDYVDKYAVRKHIADLIGEEHLIPLVGVWDSVDDIDFDELPDRCVLKCTHDSGGVVIFERGKTDIAKAKRTLRNALRSDYYLRGREWPYKMVKRRILAEQFMSNEDADKGLTDYKFMCFNGTPKMLFTCTGRTAMGVNVTFLDMNWNRLPFERHYPADPAEIKKPKTFEQMITIAEKLSADMPFVRVDLYEINGQVYFGELTLYPGCGFEEFRPDEWDEKIGAMITLPNKTDKKAC